MAGFKNLEDLVGDLSAGLVKLRAGELEPEELTPLVEDARELCDRLVLLRFKAHEFAYEVRKKAPEGGVDEQSVDRQPVRPFRIGAAYQTSLIDAIEEVSREQAEQAAEARRNAGTPGLFDEVPDTPAPAPVPVPVPAPAVAPEAEAPVDPVPEAISEAVTEAVTEALEADTPVDTEKAPERDAEAPEDLGDAPATGAETEQFGEPVVQEAGVQAVREEPDATEEPSEESPIEDVPEPSSRASQSLDSVTSLAEQMEQRAIGDLRTAFSLVEKYECIKVLFQDDAMLFDRVLEALDGAEDMQLALLWLNQHVPDSSAWDEDDPTVARFMDKLQRRYA